MVNKVWSLGLVVVVLATGAIGVIAQQPRGSSGLPDGQGNPLASLQQQINALTQQVANLSSGNAVQGGAESNLVVIRGTIGGAPAGAGFTVFTNPTLPCGTNLYPEYHVTFDQEFATTPSVVVSARDFLATPLADNQNTPVYTAAIYSGAGGIGVTTTGFTVRIKTDKFGGTCFGSYNWDFVAVGPR